MIYYDLIENAYGPFLEDWRDIKGFEGYYQVSNYGRVKILKRETLVTPKNGYKPYIQYNDEKIKAIQWNKNGYCSTILEANNNSIRVYIHRIQAAVFLFHYDDKLQVNHKNGIRYDNFILNHEMVTVSQNHKHSYAVLNRKRLNGISNYKTNRAVVMTDPITNKKTPFISMGEAAKHRQIHPTNISAFVRGVRIDNKGYIWEYANKK